MYCTAYRKATCALFRGCHLQGIVLSLQDCPGVHELEHKQ